MTCPHFEYYYFFIEFNMSEGEGNRISDLEVDNIYFMHIKAMSIDLSITLIISFGHIYFNPTEIGKKLKLKHYSSQLCVCPLWILEDKMCEVCSQSQLS